MRSDFVRSLLIATAFALSSHAATATDWMSTKFSHLERSTLLPQSAEAAPASSGNEAWLKAKNPSLFRSAPEAPAEAAPSLSASEAWLRARNPAVFRTVD